MNEEKENKETQPEENEENESKKEEHSKINAVAILSYLGILFLVPLLAAKEDEFAQYHVKQGIILFICAVVGMFIGFIPIIGWLLMPFILLASLIFAIMGIINVVNNKKKELPIIGQYADKLNI